MATTDSMLSRTPGAVSPIQINMEVSPEMMAMLADMARESKQPLEAVFRRAIALYKATLVATAEGKHVGYAASADSLDVEFTGLTEDGGE